MTQPSRKPAPKLQERQGLKSLLYLVIVVLIYVWASVGLHIQPAQLATGDAWSEMGDLVMRMGPFVRIDTCKNATTVWGDDDPYAGKSNASKVTAVCEQGKVLYWYRRDMLSDQFAYMRQKWTELMETFRMAILGAFIGSVLAVPFSLMAARNLVRSKALYYTVRTVLNLIRTIPDLALAAVLSGALGLGALPGVMALIVFSFALVAKLLSESVEAIDPGPLEAMQATGANRLQQIAFGVVPQVLPQFLAYSIYVLEVDVRASTVLGLVGAGGIGQVLMVDLNLRRYPNVGAIIVTMLLAVVIMDFVSTKLRERLV
jgi:phosphonate transport system permease protein